MKLLQQYQGAFQDQYRPGLMNQGQELALGEQNANQAIDTELGRRGMSGSGLAYAMKNANAASRSANYNQAIRDYYSQAAGAARQQADITAGRQTGTSTQNPYTYTARPGYGDIAGNAMGSFVSGYAAGQGPGAPKGLYLGYRPGQG